VIFLQKKHKMPRACHKKPRQERLTFAKVIPQPQYCLRITAHEKGGKAPYVFEPKSLEVEKFPYGPDGTRLQARVPAAAPLRPGAGRGLFRAGGE